MQRADLPGPRATLDLQSQRATPGRLRRQGRRLTQNQQEVFLGRTSLTKPILANSRCA